MKNVFHIRLLVLAACLCLAGCATSEVHQPGSDGRGAIASSEYHLGL